MYAHNCAHLVNSLRAQGQPIEVLTSNCRCFSSAQRFSVATEDLINERCHAIQLPHAPSNPGKRYGTFKYFAVRALQLDMFFGVLRGLGYFWSARNFDLVHFDQVLEAFGFVPLAVLLGLCGLNGKRVVVTVHEVDPLQKSHAWLNRLYRYCSAVYAYSEDMKRQLVALGVRPDQVRVVRYGIPMPALTSSPRRGYVFFGGHNILRGKGYEPLLDALAILQSRGVAIQLTAYVGYGCNGLDEAKQLAIDRGLSNMISWHEFMNQAELPIAYQSSKACIIPYTGGSARHPLTCAMANGTPVIATRAVDIPEYLGDLGIYVEPDGQAIADAILAIESQAEYPAALASGLRRKAMAELDVQKVAAGLKEDYLRLAS
jgi:glycosyltransferase involved in cell wall biosynthesis